MKLRIHTKHILRAASYLYIVFTFGLLDAWLRVQTRWIGAYSIFELAPNLFTLLWAILLTAVVTIPKNRKISRILYGVLYGVFMIYAVVQYGAYLVLGRFLYVSEFLLAGEGADYASWVVDMLTPGFLVQVLILIVAGVVGIFAVPVAEPHSDSKARRWILHLAVAALCVAAMLPVPSLYGQINNTDQPDDFYNPAFEYEHFTNAGFDMELTGMYQYLARDIQIQLERIFGRTDTTMIDAFFAEKMPHADNEMTGIFKGKNVIVFMMETMDDWMITPEDTPTIYRMMTQGICFSNMYTPQYANGYTFNTEFAFNVSAYPYSNGNVTYSLLRNNFDSSIGNLFAAEGYAVNSYHAGVASYYNRGQMHQVWGYEQYHSYQDYAKAGDIVSDDRYLARNNALYAAVTAGDPFFSFVITISPHLPYADEDDIAQIALEAYPQYDVEENREVAILRAKARLTDDMFAQLLQRLEADGKLEDTVLIGFGDHYAYGLSDRAQLQALSEAAGSPILERTPAFIYCAGYDQPKTVEKVMQTTDLMPTILNLFGIDVPKQIMGHDVFDAQYAGHAVFANGTWLTNTTYVKNGVIIWNNGMTDEEIAEMNRYVQSVYRVNDAILDSDYYRKQMTKQP